MRHSIAATAVFGMFLVATAHAQWTPTNATTNDPIAHANDITVTGNVAVDNATLKPWAAGKALQGTSGAFFLGRVGDTHMTSNAYYSGVGGQGWNYMAGGTAANMYFYSGDIIFRTAASGTADATLTWTSYPLQLKNSGSVLIGMGQNATSTYALDVTGSQHITGNVVVDGNINAKYQDVAEWVATDEQMAAGTVVVVGEKADNTVTASTHAYDTSVAGVVSAKPGLLLGVGDESKAKVATTGRVRVRVDATKSPIRKGDLLVTSDRPGMAMKSEPLDLGGVKIHRPGTLIGKALEPLAGGEGEILVLLSLQ